MTGSAALTTGYRDRRRPRPGRRNAGCRRRPTGYPPSAENGVLSSERRRAADPARAHPSHECTRSIPHPLRGQDALSALVGDIVGQDETTVTRALVDASQGLPVVDDAVLWTGYVYPDHASLDAPLRGSADPRPSGLRKAYLFRAVRPQPGGLSTSTASLVPHLRAQERAGTLSAGLTSLVVSYRGDVEDTAAPPATLGQEEAHDVEAAIQYAVDHGAKDVVLVGWSMGATINLILAATSKHRSRIAGLVFVGPALDWRSIIGAAARRSGIPGFLAPLFTAALTVPVSHKLPASAGRCAPPAFARRLTAQTAPVLILHSEGDTDARSGHPRT